MTQDERIKLLHPVLAEKCYKLVRLSEIFDLPILITQTLRTIEEQDALYAQGRTLPGRVVTHAKGGESYHNYGLAFDFVPLKDGKPDWESDKFDTVGHAGEALGLEWGGRWEHQDRPHFQMTFGLSIAELQAGKRPTTNES